jgi:hypothetical protein
MTYKEKRAKSSRTALGRKYALNSTSQRVFTREKNNINTKNPRVSALPG